MEITHVVTLGLVQGVTEFLPISSSGHLVLARLWLAIPDTSGTAFDAFLHLGTLLAVLVYYWRVWWGIARSLFYRDAQASDRRELLGKLLLATVPAAIMGYSLEAWVAQYFRSPATVGVALLVTALVLLVADRLQYVSSSKRASWRDAWWIGVAQVAALVPGISRSGVTMAAGRWRGLSRAQAASFSFLLSAPIIAGAGLHGLVDLAQVQLVSTVELVVGVSVAFVSGLAAIAGLLAIVQRISFMPFVYYLVVVGGLVWWYA